MIGTQPLALAAPPRRVLVVCFQRLGDVLLITALIRSLRRHWPRARLDAVVFAGTAVALEGNPDVDHVIAWPAGGGWRSTVRLFRRYDLAVATLVTDRTHLTAFAAARDRVGVVPEHGRSGARWKRWLARGWTPLDLHHSHAVSQYLRLADCVGAPRVPQLVPPRPRDDAWRARLPAGWGWRPYAVVHPAAMYRYKGWTDDGWRRVIDALVARELDVALTGGPAAHERELVATLTQGRPGAVDLAGRLAFPELTPLIAGAAIYVGPDTSVTHLAAATGCRTVALFGPTSPGSWGPWPQGFAEDRPSPWVMHAPLQHRGNVWLLQGINHCVPCLQEGCERHRDSRADCLDELPASRVIAAVDEALRSRPSAAAQV